SMQTRSRAQRRSGDDKETETSQSRFPAHRRKETGAKGSRGDERNARGVVLLQQAGFGERVRAALADDEVIQYPDIDGGQGALQPLGDRTIGGRWLGGPRGVLMRQDQRRSVERQRTLDHLPRIHRSLVDRALEQRL